MADRIIRDVHVRMLSVILACFLYTSTGYLSWVYRLMALGAVDNPDFLTLLVAYLMQALGVGVYLWLARRCDERGLRRVALVAMAVAAVLLVPSTVVGGVATTIVAGLAENVTYGLIQGFYMGELALLVEGNSQGMVFGVAYGVSTLAGWLLSLPADGALSWGNGCLVLCCLLALVAMVALRALPLPSDSGCEEGHSSQVDASLLELVPLAALAVVMVSVVKTMGFAFPSVDLGGGVSIELSRLFYGVGLVVAGLASDRDRRLGLLVCGLALVTPFLMLALSGAGVSGAPLWALEYFLTGFYVLFRVLLFADLARGAGVPHLAGAGLMFGRIGDALGEGLFLLLAGAPVALIAATTLLFVATTGVLLALYQRLFVRDGQAASLDVAPMPGAAPMPDVVPVVAPPSEREVFERFAAEHGLTARERDVLRLVLDERSNAEIAGTLGVSEQTVKFHVGNLLKKTGCKSRLEVLAAYAGVRPTNA